MNVAAVVATIAHDIETGLADIEQEAETGVLAVWNWSKSEVIKLLPSVEEDMLLLAEAAVQKASSNEIGDIVQTMIMLGEQDGKNILETVGEDTLNLLASLAKAKANSAAAAAPAAAG